MREILTSTHRALTVAQRSIERRPGSCGLGWDTHICAGEAESRCSGRAHASAGRCVTTGEWAPRRYLDADTYHAEWARLQATAQQLTAPLDAFHGEGDMVLRYHSQAQFEQFAKKLRIMSEWKAGVPRGSYQGVVVVRVNNGRGRLFLAPGPQIHLHAEGYIVPPGGGRP